MRKAMGAAAAALRWSMAVVCLLAGAGCASLPPNVERTSTSAFTQAETAGTALGQALRQRIQAHPQLSGFHALPIAQDAFAARMLLARHAQRSLDMQYYIWHADTTGQLLWQAAWQAAERGVRVRLLLDDANTGGLDPTLAALDAHPNIEVRLFNPFPSRRLRLVDFATDFTRLNHRMHNKSFTVDNQVAIVGGRNIGDEYFGANTDVGFQDLDVMTIGPLVQDVSREFDLYWNSPYAYPAARVIGRGPADGKALLQQDWDQVHQSAEAQRYVQAVQRSGLVESLDRNALALEWTTGRVLYDDPAKVRATADRTDLQLLPKLIQAMGQPEKELDLVSPYFVPGKKGSDDIEALARSRIKVRVLTNSLSATDVAAVHAGYIKYRKELLEAGVTLYELKPGSALPPAKDGDDDRTRGLGGSGSSGSSTASLHAKTIAVDRSRIFVGSFNLDPRSAHLNTEMGIVIDSPVLAGGLSSQLDDRLPNEAYEVKLTSDGKLEWIEHDARGITRYSSEPGSPARRRLWVDFLSLLPIEWML
ncbi:MAG: phospholipase D family protein [Variovorax sp.]